MSRSAIDLIEEIFSSFRQKEIWDALAEYTENRVIQVSRGEDDGPTGILSIKIDHNSDVWIRITGSDHRDGSVRFCTADGRGKSLKTLRVLWLLAVAIVADHEEFPDSRIRDL